MVIRTNGLLTPEEEKMLDLTGVTTRALVVTVNDLIKAGKVTP